ncbi:hypothetical protein JW948_00925 [bacterium]|nr:hypothetical protein [bacterium]
MKHSILIAGSATRDENIVRGARYHKIGGVPVYAGLTWRLCGVKTLIVSNIADRDEPVHRLFSGLGFDLPSGTTQRTTSFINSYDGDNRSQSMPHAAETIMPDQIIGAWGETAHIHLGPLHPQDLSPDIYGLDFGSRLVFLDVQGLTRAVRHGRIVPAVFPEIEKALTAAHFIKTDESELNLILEYLQIPVTRMASMFHIQEIIETRAHTGGVVHSSDASYFFDAAPKQEIIDTTGAGDVFFAAYLNERIFHHKNIQESCKQAARLAAHHIEGQWIQSDLLILND